MNLAGEADPGAGPYLSARQVAALFNISRATVYRLAASPDPKKHWPSHRIGGSVRFSPQDVEQIIAKSRNQRADIVDQMTSVIASGSSTRSKARRTRRW
jgi:excisionase family DNA binding protein